jgi:hypothetical protein
MGSLPSDPGEMGYKAIFPCLQGRRGTSRRRIPGPQVVDVEQRISCHFGLNWAPVFGSDEYGCR